MTGLNQKPIIVLKILSLQVDIKLQFIYFVFFNYNDIIKIFLKNFNTILFYFFFSDSVKDSSMILVNAIYFNGNWAKPFEHSSPKVWHMDGNVSKNVSTMHLRGRFKHGDLLGVDAKFVILPYEAEIFFF